MLDAKAEIFLARLLLCEGKSVQGHACATVADGMESQLKSGARTLRRLLVQRLLLVAWNAGIFRIVVVRREHGGSTGTKRTIHEALEHGGVQHGILGGMV